MSRFAPQPRDSRPAIVTPPGKFLPFDEQYRPRRVASARDLSVDDPYHKKKILSHQKVSSNVRNHNTQAPPSSSKNTKDMVSSLLTPAKNPYGNEKMEDAIESLSNLLLDNFSKFRQDVLSNLENLQHGVEKINNRLSSLERENEDMKQTILGEARKRQEQVLHIQEKYQRDIGKLESEVEKKQSTLSIDLDSMKSHQRKMEIEFSNLATDITKLQCLSVDETRSMLEQQKLWFVETKNTAKQELHEIKNQLIHLDNSHLNHVNSTKLELAQWKQHIHTALSQVDYDSRQSSRECSKRLDDMEEVVNSVLKVMYQMQGSNKV